MQKRNIHTFQPPRNSGKKLFAGIMGLLCCIPNFLHGQSHIDEVPGQGITVLRTDNGLPLVNITSPDGQGISINHFHQFDVDGHGAILNNSRTGAMTHLGGQIAGNPHMARGEAQLIVSQTNSTAPSQLQGMIEIGGQKADVIMANPAGLVVNGGFINAGQVHYTAGHVEQSKDGLIQHTSPQGQLSIARGGLDARNHDYTTLLSRSVQINDAIHAGEGTLDIITGLNSRRADGSLAVRDGTETENGKPRFAIDSSALGGMYANRIRLIGTENGVGVRHKGTIQTEDLTVNTLGHWQNDGKIQAEKLTVKHSGYWQNNGELSAVTLDMHVQDMENRGVLRHEGQGGMSISSAALINMNKSSLMDRADKAKPDEKQASSDNTTPEKEKLDVAQIQARAKTLREAKGSLKVDGELVNREGEISSASRITLESHDFANQGELQVARLKNTGGFFDTQEGQTVIDHAEIHASYLKNRRGNLFLRNAADIQIEGGLDNLAGNIQSSGGLNIQSGFVRNGEGGKIVTEGALNLEGRQGIFNGDGEIVAADSLRLHTEGLLSNNGLISGDLLHLSAERMQNDGKIIQRGPYALNIHTEDYDSANSPYNTIRFREMDDTPSPSTHTATVAAPAAEGTLKIRSYFENNGLFDVNGLMSMTASRSFINHRDLQLSSLTLTNNATLDNESGSIRSQRMNLATSTINNQQGKLQTNQLAMHTGTLDNQQGQLNVSGTGRIDIREQLDNRSGNIQANNNLNITLAGNENHNDQGSISSGKNLIMQNHGLWDNGTGKLIAGEKLAVYGGSFTSHGHVQAGKDATLTGFAHFRQEGELLAGGHLTLDSQTLKNTGNTATLGTLNLSAPKIDNTGKLVAQGAFTVRSTEVNNQGGQIQAQDALFLTAKTLDNQRGKITSEDALDIKATDTFANEEGQISGKKSVSLQSAAIDNESGSIGSEESVTLESPILKNHKGKIGSKGQLFLNIADSIDNSEGQLAGEGDWEIATKTLDNRKGTIHGGEALAIKVDSLDNQGGSMDGKNQTIQAAQINNASGKLLGEESLTISTDGTTLNNRDKGYIASKGKLDISGKTEIDNRGLGRLSGGELKLDVEGIRGGALHSNGDVDLNSGFYRDIESITSGGNLNINSRSGYNALGLHYSLGWTKINTPEGFDVSRGGSIQAEGNLEINAGSLSNEGLLAGNGLTNINAGGGIVNDGGRIYGQVVNLKAPSLLNDNRGAIAATRQANLTIAGIENNHGASISSFGDMLISGQSLYNDNRGDIGASGNMVLEVGVVDNADELQYIEHVDVSKSKVSFTFDGVVPGEWIPYNQRGKGDYLYKYNEIVSENRSFAKAPGFIHAGGTLTFNGDVSNKGRIAAGTISGTIDNHKFPADPWLRAENGEIFAKDDEGKWEKESISGYSPPSIPLPNKIYQVGEEKLQSVGASGGASLPSGGRSRIITTIDASGNPVSYHTLDDYIPELPQSNLFQINYASLDGQPGAEHDQAGHALITLDPVFAKIPGLPHNTPTQYSINLGGNPYTAPLAANSLGDHYYNLDHVMRQVVELSGYRYLKGFADDNEQYAKLLAAGERFRVQNQLPPGVNLSNEQMARLNEDMILMVDRTITLPDGREITRKVPQVYAKVRPDDLDTSRPTMGANRIVLRGDTFNNSSQIGGRDQLRLNYRNIDNRGVLASNYGQVHATDTFRNRGGEIRAGGYFSATADKVFDFGAATTTQREKQEGEATTGSYHNHHLISESGKLTRTEKNSTVILGGAAQTTISASDLDLGDASSRTLIRGSNIHLGAEYVFSEDMDRKDDRNFKYRFEGIQRGVHTTGDGDLTVNARGKLTGTAAQLHSGQSDISLYGANGVDLSHGQHISKTAEASHRKSRRILSSKTNTGYSEQEIRDAVPGSVSARNVSIIAGKGADLNLAGQYISSDHGTHLQAGNNITVTAGINQEHGIYNASQKKSGLFANFKSGKLGVGYRQSQGHTQEEYERFSLTPSLIASNKGDVTFQAGGKITTRASGVVAGNDILMRARNIDIDVAAVSETGTQQGNSKQRSMGITADLRDPTLKSLQTLFKGLDKNARGNARDTIQGVDKSVLASSMSLIEPPLQDHLTHARGNQQKNSHLIHIGGSALEAVGNIQLQAIGGDLNIIGSQVHGEKGVQLQASRNLNILAAESLASSSSQLNNKVHGHTGGGATVFTGHTMDAAGGKVSQGKLHASTVTSSGDISLTAGQHYQQTGSHVKSLGNIDLTARTVDIQAAQTHDSQNNRQSHVDKGLSGSLGGNGINQLQAASESVQRLGESQKFRTNLMNAANSIMSGYNAGKAISEGKVSPSITITYGENNSKGEQSRQSSSLEASSLLADGKVRINATGGNLHIGGSDVAGKQGTHLNAKGKIILSAAQQSEHQRHSSSESGWKAGVALTADNGIALGIHAGGHYGKGEGAGESTQWRLTRIGNMNSQTTLRSGEATQLIGAQVSGKGVQLNSKGLHIQSLQNTASYDSESYRIGGDGTIGWGVAAGNLEYGNSKVHHSHQSIDQPSGIFAGDDGYQIQVDGHTHLEGGLVTSSTAAEQNGNNSFITKTLTYSGLDNHSRHQGKALAIGIQASTDGNSGSANPSFGFGQDKHNAQSHTASGISTANLHITDAYQQEKLSGQSIAQTQAAIRSDIHLREAESAGSAVGKLANTFNPGRLERELQLERDASQAFMQNAPQLVALTAEQLGDLKAHEIRQTAQQLDRQALAQTSDPEQRAILQQRIDKRQQELDANQANYEQWKEGGTARNLLHAAAGGLLAGNWQGAASSYAASASAPALNRLDNPLFNRLAAPAMGALIGAGEPGSIMAAGGTDWNNRRLHPSERKIIDGLAENLAQKNPEGIYLSEDEWKARLTLVANALVDENYNDILLQEISRSGWQSGDGKTLGGKYLRSLEVAIDVLQEERNRPNFLTWTDGSPIKAHGKPVQIFGATPEQYRDHKLFGATQPDNPYNYVVGKEPVENYLKQRFDNTYGAGSHKHTDEILNFEFESRKGLPQRQQLEKDYYSYSGTGEVYPSYPEDWVMLGHGLLRNLPKNLGKQAGKIPNTSQGTANIFTGAELKLDLRTIESANEVVDSLRTTGKLPKHYVSKKEAEKYGWTSGKALNNHIPGAQIGGDIFKNSPTILPKVSGRIWYEVDIGLKNTVSRAKQDGTRLLYSNDGLLYITRDHYETVIPIGRWK